MKKYLFDVRRSVTTTVTIPVYAETLQEARATFAKMIFDDSDENTEVDVLSITEVKDDEDTVY